MSPPDKLLSIETRLASGVLSVDDACAELFSGPKPWSTAWWKAERERLLGAHCATCTSAEPPLVLQHTWQPIKWKDALRQVGPPNWDWWKEYHPLPPIELSKELLVERPVCPVCNSIRVRSRAKTNDWVCHAGQCGAPHERHDHWAFRVPRYEFRRDIKSVNRSERAEYESVSQKRWDDWLSSPESAINRFNALRLCISESKRYLSFRDTKTLCKRCAAREDVSHIRESWSDGF